LNTNTQREDWFWRLASLALAGVILFSILISFHYPWQKPIFPNADFEKGDLTNWGVQGSAFQNQPTYEDNPFYRQRGTANLQGKYWVGSYENRPTPASPKGASQGDSATGSLESIDFTIARGRICFLLGGGNGTKNSGVALFVDGKQVLFEPGRGSLIDSERMSRITWDVSQWKGKKARIMILDDAAQGWGHINADDFRYT
jgi:hypothetical protein